MSTGKRTKFDEELGKAVCDRLGLPHDSTLTEWTAEREGQTVWVTMTVGKVMPLDEYNELLKVALERGKA